MEKRYHLIPINFEIYNFERLIDKYNKNGYLVFPNGKENCRYYSTYNKGDIVYIYYFNLPDYTKRILLKGEVLDSDKKDDDIYSYSIKRKIKGLKLTNLKPLALRKPDKFSFESLKDKYEICFIQNHRYLDDNNKLIKDLERCSQNCRTSFSYIKEYFDTNIRCACKGLYRNNSHKVFKREDGFYYYEVHHLIVQNNETRIKLRNKNYYNEKFNTFLLCPACHGKIHHGNLKERREMIKHLYLKNKKDIDKLLFNVARGKELKWLFKQYLTDAERIKILS